MRRPRADGPCACGSGRPFQACCATRFAADLAAWRQAQEAERRVVKSIVEYAFRTWGWGLFARALRLFSMQRHSPEALLISLPVFDRWFALRWIANHEEPDMDVPDTWPTASLGVSWLASGSTTASSFDQAFIVSAAGSPYSVFQVEEVCAGWFLMIRDLMSERRFRAVDPEVSARARPDDILLSAVLSLGGVSTLLGAAPYTLPSDSRAELLDLKRAYSDAPWMTRAELMEWDLAGDLCDEYTEAFTRGAASALDTCGGAREPLHLRWTVTISVEDMLERLRPLSLCYVDEEAIDIESGPEGEPHVLMTWYQPGPSAEEDDWMMIGCLYLDEGRLAADVPTRMLADRLIVEVAERLGAGATLVDRRPGAPVRVHTRGCWLPVPSK